MEKMLNPIYKFFDLFHFQPNLGLKKGTMGILKGPIIPSLLLTVCMAMAGAIVMRYTNLEIWRHDSFQFTPESSWYYGNLQQEGRWINYFLFDLLKAIPGHAAAIINLLLLFLFGFLITEGVFEDKISRSIFGLTLLMMPVFHAQNMWPNITFGAVVFLPVVYYLSKKIHPFLVFGIAAIYYFGTLSNFYFLVPLVYMEQMKKSLSGKFKKDLFYFSTKIVLPFALCFVIGFFVANGIVMAKTGTSITLGEWRNPSPANSIEQLMINFKGVNRSMFQFGSKLFCTIPLLVWILFLPMLLLSLNKKTVWSLALLIMVFLAAFYTTTYHGIFISERTLCVSAAAFILILCLIPALRFQANILHLTLCVALAFFFFKDSYNQLDLFAKTTSYYKQQLAMGVQNFVPEENYEVVIFAEKTEVVSINKQIEEQLGLDFKWGEALDAVDRTITTPLRSLGYYKVIWVKDKKMINDIKGQLQQNTRKDPFVVVSLNNRPNSIGIVINSTEVDPITLDQL